MGLWDIIAGRRQKAEARPTVYRQYTKAFDREIDAKDLDSVLGRQSDVGEAALAEAWEQYQQGLAGWRARTQIVALNHAADIQSELSSAFLSECCVSFLLDQSGSMRGQNMLMALAAVDCAQDFVVGLGCKTEILGFTTSSWKGGKSREKWKGRGRIALPGRLCDLLHIVYVSTNTAVSGTGAWALRPMLRPDLPKENVDGEAVEWAAARLRLLGLRQKFLIVISDGAPVDDSTLQENGTHYLSDHLRSVIATIEAGRDIRLSAVGIGHDVTPYYGMGPIVQTPNDLGETLIGMIKDQLIAAHSAVSMPRA